MTSQSTNPCGSITMDGCQGEDSLSEQMLFHDALKSVLDELLLGQIDGGMLAYQPEAYTNACSELSTDLCSLYLGMDKQAPINLKTRITKVSPLLPPEPTLPPNYQMESVFISKTANQELSQMKDAKRQCIQEETRFECVKCGRKFGRKRHLERHIQMVHRKKAEVLIPV